MIGMRLRLAMLFALSMILCFYLTLRGVEKEVVSRLADRVELLNSEKGREQLTTAVDVVCTVLEPLRKKNYHNLHRSSLVSTSLSPTLEMYFFGIGACGNASLLTVKVLQELGYRSTPILVLDENGGTSHVIVRVFTGYGDKSSDAQEVIIDPLFNWIYLNVDGEPAELEELTNSWKNLIADVPNKGIEEYPIEHGIATLFASYVPRDDAFPQLKESLPDMLFVIESMLPGFYERRLLLVISLLLIGMFFEFRRLRARWTRTNPL